MKVLAHADPVVLERELLARVDEAHPRGAVGRTLVLVPTRRLAEHVLRRLAERRPAWLGLRVLSFAGLAREILERSTGSTLHVADSLLLQALLRRLLRERPRSLWGEFVGRRPGAAGRILETLEELREAGVDPADVAACATGDERARDLAALYARYHGALEDGAAQGWTDAAGIARAARAHAPAYGERLSAVFVHGAYEILGVYLDLIRELDRVTELSVLVPVAEGSRATAYAERFARSFLVAAGGSLETPSDDDPGRTERLASLYDETSEPPAAPEAFAFRHAQGAAAEVKYAVREALRAVRDGCPPAEIVITARSLEPYAAAVEEALEDAGLEWTSSLSSPLRRHPIVREFLLLLRVCASGFPRNETVELLEARHLDWKKLGCDRRPPAGRADRWSREARLIDGLDEWTSGLEAWAVAPRRRPAGDPEQRRREDERARERAAQAVEIGDAVRRLDAAVPRGDARWSRHAEALTELLGTLFRSRDDAAVGRLREILDVMADLELLVSDTREITFDTMLAWLEEAVAVSRLTLRRFDGGGIRVLDAMQLRGGTFRRVHLLGMNSGVLPRAPRADAVLTDDVRRTLRERTGRPVVVESEAPEQEHLLLMLLLGSACERTDVSWQRADESGRARVPSIALREVARAAFGRPEVEPLRAAARHLPSHPGQWLDELVDGTGLLAPGEEMLLAALHSRAADAATKLGRRFPQLLPGLEMLRATQSFTPVADRYDARVGPIERDKPFSVTELESLGRCPLQFFFGSILGVKPLEERAGLFHLAANELGTRIHELIEQLYRDLGAEGAFDGGDERRLVARGLELLDELRGRVLGEIGARLARRLPLLWDRVAATWFETVRRFVDDDLRRIGRDRLRPRSFEELACERLDFGDGVAATVRGKFDRLLEGERGPLVGDYKTSRSLAWRVQPTSMLKAHALQVPLYRMMAGPGAIVELLGVNPELDPAQGDHRYEFAGFEDEQVARSFLHTMQVLLRLFREGSYPFHKNDLHCGWCDFDKACRRNHPPTQERELQLEDARAFRKLKKKSRRNPHVP